MYPQTLSFFADATARVRLVVTRASGLTQVYTVVRGDKGIWSILSAPSEAEGVPTPLNPGIFVLDAHTGAPCKADKAHLTVALEPKASSKASEEAIRCLLLIVGAKGARCLADLGEERVAKVEWGQKAGHVVRAQVVERNGSGIPSFDCPYLPSNSIHFRIFRAGCVHRQTRGTRVFSPDARISAHITIAHCLVDVSVLGLDDPSAGGRPLIRLVGPHLWIPLVTSSRSSLSLVPQTSLPLRRLPPIAPPAVPSFLQRRPTPLQRQLRVLRHLP
jgi:hypothetical protein